VPRRKRKQIAEDKVTAADVIAFIERTCFIPEGKFVGQKLKLFDWQKDLLRLIYDNPHGTRRAIVSMGRKGGKTSLSACLLLAHLCGPPARNKPNSQLYSAAQSRDQAAIIFSLAAKMVRLKSGVGAGCDHSGDRKITHLSGIGDAISSFERRRHHGLWAFSAIGHSR
jgi:phage terminase large subunit-like protein